MGLDGIIFDMLKRCDFATPTEVVARHGSHWGGTLDRGGTDHHRRGARRGREPCLCEEPGDSGQGRQRSRRAGGGLTGTGGAGKSCLTDELVRRFLNDFPDKTVAVLCVDPSKRRTGGALLGDRIRMNAVHDPRAYMRSLATRQSHSELSDAIRDAIERRKGRRVRSGDRGDQRHRPGGRGHRRSVRRADLRDDLASSERRPSSRRSR